MARFKYTSDGRLVHREYWTEVEGVAPPEIRQVTEYDLIGDAWGRAFGIQQTMEWLTEYGFDIQQKSVEQIQALMDREYKHFTEKKQLEKQYQAVIKEMREVIAAGAYSFHHEEICSQWLKDNPEPTPEI